MPIQQTPQEVFESEFLGVRARILEIAAVLDRMNRAGGPLDDDPRWPQLAESLNVLQGEQPDRAERVQMIFSRDFRTDWRGQLGFDIA